MKPNILNLYKLFLAIIWALGVVIRQGFAQENGNALQSECQIAIQALESACSLELLDDLASLSIEQFNQCCQYANSIRLFGCYDPCEVVLSEMSSIQYPIWRPLCDHNIEPCTPSPTSTPTPTPSLQNFVEMKSDVPQKDTVVLGQQSVPSNDNAIASQTIIIPTNKTSNLASMFEQQLGIAVDSLNQTSEGSVLLGNISRGPTALYRSAASAPHPQPTAVIHCSESLLEEMMQDPQLATSAKLFSSSPVFLQHIQGSSVSLLAPTESAWLVFAIKVGLRLTQDLMDFQYLKQVLETHMVWSKHKLSNVQDKVRLLTLGGDIIRVFRDPNNDLVVEGCCEDGNIVKMVRADAYESDQIEIHVIDDVLLPSFAFQNRTMFYAQTNLYSNTITPPIDQIAQNMSTIMLGDRMGIYSEEVDETISNDQAYVLTSNDQQPSYSGGKYNDSIELVSTLTQDIVHHEWAMGYNNERKTIIEDEVGECKLVSQVLEENINLGNFYTIIKHANLLQVLDELPQRYGNYTLLAPDNQAFGRLIDIQVFEDILMDAQKVEWILSYLIIPQQLNFNDIARSDEILRDTILSSDEEALQLSFRKLGNFTTIEGISGSTILPGTNIQACDVSLYYIDTVILPFKIRSLSR